MMGRLPSVSVEEEGLCAGEFWESFFHSFKETQGGHKSPSSTILQYLHVTAGYCGCYFGIAKGVWLGHLGWDFPYM